MRWPQLRFLLAGHTAHNDEGTPMNLMSGWSSNRPERRLVVSGICGMICLAVAGPVAAEDTFGGVYTGKRVLTKGSGPRCPAEDDVSVTIHGETLTFANSALKNFLIAFNPHQDGSFSQISVDIDGDTVTIQGRVTGGFFDADVTNAPCEYHWHLKKG